MRFTILSIDSQTGTVKLLDQTDDPVQALAAEASIRRPKFSPHVGAASAHGNCRAVIVCEDPAQDCEIPLRRGDSFVSAAILDTALGFKYPAVAIALSKARRAGDLTATLRGVTFCYTSDYEAVALQDAKVD